MSENCNPQNCSSCPSAGNCNSQPKSMLEEPNKMSNIGKVIGVVSGKGGVGKTLVSSLLAVSMKRLGKNVGILDADITGRLFQRLLAFTIRLMPASLELFL